MKSIFYLTLLLIFPHSMHAEDYASKYAGQEYRAIKSLSSDDIQELQNGGGWGLAKAAELNGIPGPAHILEMAQKIHLTEEQQHKIKAIHNDMKYKAVALGEQLIELEKELNSHFASETITTTLLENLIRKIEDVRAKLRTVHLSTHLQTPSILTNEQIRLYNQLRGYAKDPCEHIPEGHNAQMWKKHNGCK